MAAGRKQAEVSQHGVPAGQLCQTEEGDWTFTYVENYDGQPVSLTLPVRDEAYTFAAFPAVFEGLLPSLTSGINPLDPDHLSEALKVLDVVG